MTSSKEEVGRYGEHIAVSVTNSCPLKCKHCISGSAPDTARGDPALVATFDKLLSEWNVIEHVTFTGGEPFHYPKKLKEFAECADAHHVRYGVITGAFWAKSERSCSRYLNTVRNLATMTISTDLYHLQFVTQRHVLNAVRAARARDIHVKVRFTHAEPMTSDEVKINEDLRAELHEHELEYAPMQKYGRAVENGIGRTYDRWSTQEVETKYGICPSTGPHVFENGRTTPCCNTIVSLRDDGHPLVFGNMVRDGVNTVLENRERNTLWLAIKVLGFDWLKERMVERNPAYQDYAPINACDFCFDFCKAGGINSDVAAIMADPHVQLYVHSVAAFAQDQDPDPHILSRIANEIKKQDMTAVA